MRHDPPRRRLRHRLPGLRDLHAADVVVAAMTARPEPSEELDIPRLLEALDYARAAIAIVAPSHVGAYQAGYLAGREECAHLMDVKNRHIEELEHLLAEKGWKPLTLGPNEIHSGWLRP